MKGGFIDQWMVYIILAKNLQKGKLRRLFMLFSKSFRTLLVMSQLSLITRISLLVFMVVNPKRVLVTIAICGMISGTYMRVLLGPSASVK